MEVADESLSLSNLSLEPRLRRDNLSEPLESLVPRIGLQYGGFRNVTEAELKNEISERTRPTHDESLNESSEDEDEKTAEECKGSNEAIFARRREMSAFLGAAMQDTLMVVDFISLLETKTQARAADTMSPALRQAGLPNGALGHETWQPRQDPVASEQARLAALGRSMESLTSAADALLGAAERLTKDVKRESQYWKHILSVTERGWSVYRAPGRRAVALQFGVNEAGPLFRNRGFAELVPNEDGSIRLVQDVPAKPKALRLRYRRNGATISESVGGRIQIPGGLGEELELQIRAARDSLFEEELFHEMAIEARSMASLGVRNRDGTIHLPIPSHGAGPSEEILVDLIPRNAAQGYSEDLGSAGSSVLTRDILVSSQLLLCHAHRQRYHRRTNVPAPLSDVKHSEIAPQVLRPILALTTHNRAIQSVSTILQELKTTSGPSALQVDWTRQRLSNLERITALPGNAFNIIERLLRPLATRYTLQVTTDAKVAKEYHAFIEVHTQLAISNRNNYGTDFVLHIPSSLDLTKNNITKVPSPPLTPPPLLASSDVATATQILTFDDMDDLRLYLYSRLAVTPTRD